MKTNINNIYLTAFILLLIMSASPPIFSQSVNYFHPLTTDYSNCKMKLFDDQSIEVSFSATMAGRIFNNNVVQEDNWKKQVGTNHSVKMNSKQRLVYLFFYQEDGSGDHNIDLNKIQSISLDGVSRSDISLIAGNMYQIIFTQEQPFASGQHIISFKLAPNMLKKLALGAAIGGVLQSEDQFFHLIDTRGVSFGRDGQRCQFFNPQNSAVPEPLYVDPKFTLKSVLWQLNSVELDDLTEMNKINKGFPAQLSNPVSNQFCLSYMPLGTQRKKYMISATNENGLDSSNRFFQLRESHSDKTINYQVRLNNVDGLEAINFSLPLNNKFITLSSEKNIEKGTTLCWNPVITLYSTRHSDKGSYSDSLIFTITPAS